MIDNIRVVAWLFFCLLFELLVITIVSPLHGAEREALWKNPSGYGALAGKMEKSSEVYAHQ